MYLNTAKLFRPKGLAQVISEIENSWVIFVG